MWLLNATLFFVLFVFALNNQETVTLHLFFGTVWQIPLVLLLLYALLIGVVLGLVVMLPLWLRARKKAHTGHAENFKTTSPATETSQTSHKRPASEIQRDGI